MNIDWPKVVATIIGAVLIGAVSSYISFRVQLSTTLERIRGLEEQTAALETREQIRRDNMTDVRERVIRIETNVNLLVERWTPNNPDSNE